MKGFLYVVGIRRFGEIVRRAELDRLDRGGDAREAGEHDDPHRRVRRAQRLHAGEAGRVAELEVDDGIARAKASE